MNLIKKTDLVSASIFKMHFINIYLREHTQCLKNRIISCKVHCSSLCIFPWLPCFPLEICHFFVFDGWPFGLFFSIFDAFYYISFNIHFFHLIFTTFVQLICFVMANFVLGLNLKQLSAIIVASSSTKKSLKLKKLIEVSFISQY